MNEFTEIFIKHDVEYRIHVEEFFDINAVLLRIDHGINMMFDHLIDLKDGRMVAAYRIMNISDREIKEGNIYFNLSKLPDKYISLPLRMTFVEHLDLFEAAFIFGRFIVVACRDNIKQLLKEKYGIDDDLGNSAKTYQPRFRAPQPKQISSLWII